MEFFEIDLNDCFSAVHYYYGGDGVCEYKKDKLTNYRAASGECSSTGKTWDKEKKVSTTTAKDAKANIAKVLKK